MANNSSNLPTITSSIPPDLRNFLNRVREQLSANGGVNTDAIIANVISQIQSGNVLLSGGGTTYATPPAPAGLMASGAMAVINLTWTAPSYTGHAYTEIWRNTSNSMTGFELIGLSAGNVYSDNVGGGATYYYWIRFVNRNQTYTPGPYNSTTGTEGETGTDPNYILGLIANATNLNPVQIAANAFEITSTDGTISPFTVITAPTVINGVTVSPGVYINTAYIIAAQINGAQIGDLSANNITSGTLSASLIAANSLNGDVITAGTLTADRIDTTSLSAISANMGTVTGGTFIAGVGTGWRVEMSDDTSGFPLWYGQGAKTADNGLFYVTSTGELVIQGSSATSPVSINVNNRFTVAPDGTVNILPSSTSGQRMQITSDVIKVYDASGTVRVQLGDLSA